MPRGGPRAELKRIRATRDRDASAPVQEMERAALEACGEVGFRAFTVQDVVDRCGSNRGAFYRHFESKGQAFARAHERELDAVQALLLGACAEGGGGEQGLRAAVAALSRYARTAPLRARALLLEVHLAGLEALDARRATHRALAAHLAGMGAASSDGAPPLGARLVVAAVDSAAADCVRRGDPGGLARLSDQLAAVLRAVSPIAERTTAGGESPPAS